MDFALSRVEATFSPMRDLSPNHGSTLVPMKTL
jgi:hypothetical protein